VQRLLCAAPEVERLKGERLAAIRCAKQANDVRVTGQPPDRARVAPSVLHPTPLSTAEERFRLRHHGVADLGGRWAEVDEGRPVARESLGEAALLFREIDKAIRQVRRVDARSGY
jgi:hypothetical protein